MATVAFVEDRHEKSRSPQDRVAPNSTNSTIPNHTAGRLLVLGELEAKIAMLESVIEDKDSQIKAMLETLDEKEKEIEELRHSTRSEDTRELTASVDQNKQQEVTERERQQQAEEKETQTQPVSASEECQLLKQSHRLELAKLEKEHAGQLEQIYQD